MIKELVTRFGFEIDDHGLKELQTGIDAVKEGILHLGELLLGEAAGLYELVEHAADAGEQLRIMSQETGIAADKLQELQFRAKLVNVSTEELNQSMFFLSRNMNAAREGSEEIRRTFRQLGISTAELRSGTMTADQVLARLSKTFEKMPDGPRKAGLAAEVFGRSGARMIPLLNALHRELDPTNRKLFEMSVITDGQIEASETFQENLKTLKAGLAGIVNVVGFGLMPAATEVIEQIKIWVAQNRQLIVTNLTEFVKGMTAALKLTLKIVDALVQSFAGFAHGIGGVRIATELLLGTFAVLSGATVLFGIGKVIQAVVELGNAFAIANLKAAAIPIAIGAAMVAIFLIMEDIYSFFNGKKSFTGDLLNVLPEIGKLFKTIFEPIFEPFVKIITMMTEGIGSWKDLFKEIGVLILNVLLTPLRATLGAVGAIASVIGRITNSDKIKAFAQGASDFADNYLKVTSGPTVTPTGISPQTAVGPTTNNRQNRTSLQVKQEFNFPPGTDPLAVGDKIASKASTGLDDVLRSTNQSTYDGGGY